MVGKPLCMMAGCKREATDSFCPLHIIWMRQDHIKEVNTWMIVWTFLGIIGVMWMIFEIGQAAKWMIS